MINLLILKLDYVFFCKIFNLKVINPTNGLSYSQEEIFSSLKSIVKNSNEKGPSMGILTAEDRDVWADSYEKLSQSNIIL